MFLKNDVLHHQVLTAVRQCGRFPKVHVHECNVTFILYYEVLPLNSVWKAILTAYKFRWCAICVQVVSSVLYYASVLLLYLTF